MPCDGQIASKKGFYLRGPARIVIPQQCFFNLMVEWIDSGIGLLLAASCYATAFGRAAVQTCDRRSIHLAVLAMCKLNAVRLARVL